MAIQPNPDRNVEFMMQMWGTNALVTDYSSEIENKLQNKQVIQEIMHDELKKHDFKTSNILHEKIRNDEDYDDWEYGTEPTYGRS